MKNSGKLLLALAVALKASGGHVAAGTFVGDDLASVVHRCAYYSELDRMELQTVLEQLLENDPDDDCIPFVVDLLGGSPLAETTPTSGSGGTTDVLSGGPNDDPNGIITLPNNNDVYP